MTEEPKIRVLIVDHLFDSKGGRKYINYVIEVLIVTTKWKVKRRFTDFLNLDRKLKNLGQFSELPKVPGKKLLGNQNEAFVAKRQIKLQEYLEKLMENQSLILTGEVTKFLEISGVLANYLGTLFRRSDEIRHRRKLLVSQLKNEQITEDEFKIHDFLLNLNYQEENKIYYLERFKDDFQKSHPIYDQRLVQKLFEGDEMDKGMIHFCHRNENLAGVRMLELLNLLLQVEYNRDAEKYRRIFNSFDLQKMKHLDFERWLCDDRIDNTVYDLIKIYETNNPQFDLKLLISDESLDDFNAWKLSKPAKRRRSTLMIKPIDKEIDYELEITDAFAKYARGAITLENNPLTKKYELKVDKGVFKVYFKPNLTAQLVSVLACPAKRAYETILASEYRGKWDMSCVSSRVTNKIDENHDTVETTYITNYKTKTTRELSRYFYEKDGHYVVITLDYQASRILDNKNPVVSSSVIKCLPYTPTSDEITRLREICTQESSFTPPKTTNNTTTPENLLHPDSAFRLDQEESKADTESGSQGDLKGSLSSNMSTESGFEDDEEFKGPEDPTEDRFGQKEFCKVVYEVEMSEWISPLLMAEALGEKNAMWDSFTSFNYFLHNGFASTPVRGPLRRQLTW